MYQNWVGTTAGDDAKENCVINRCKSIPSKNRKTPQSDHRENEARTSARRRSLYEHILNSSQGTAFDYTVPEVIMPKFQEDKVYKGELKRGQATALNELPGQPVDYKNLDEPPATASSGHRLTVGQHTVTAVTASDEAARLPQNGALPKTRPASDYSKPKGSYFNDNRRKTDFILAYSKQSNDDRRKGKTKGDKNSDSNDTRRQFFMDNLSKAGLELEVDMRPEDASSGEGGKTMTYVKIHTPWPVLCHQAELLRMKMPLILEDLGDESGANPSADRSNPVVDEEEGESCWSRFWNLKFLEVHSDEKPSAGAGNGEHITWPFSRKRIDRFNIVDEDTFFSPCQRMEIVWEVLQQCRNDPSHEKRRGIEALLEHGVFDDAFPLHDGDYDFSSTAQQGIASEQKMTTRQILYYYWANWKCTFRPQPLNRVRNYFGEKVGFYFAFMDFYTKMLVFPSLFGTLACLYGIVSVATSNKQLIDDICDANSAPGNFVMCPICKPPSCTPFTMAHESCTPSTWEYRLDNEATMALSCLTIVWCALFLKFWRRREAHLAAEWDTADMNGDDFSAVVIRPAYEERAPAQRQHPVTMEMEPYVPGHYRFAWTTASVVATVLMLTAASACLTGLVISRIKLYGALRNLGGTFEASSVEWARFLVHGLIFVMVVMFETIYHTLAEKLTELECPKTNADFLSSLLWKVFIFAEFVDFVPIAYAAWFKGRFTNTPKELDFISEICEPSGCMGEVVELVAVLLLCRLVFGNLGEVGWPFLKAVFARFRASKKAGASGGEEDGRKQDSWPQYVKDVHLNELELDGVAEEYMEMMIQLSFVVFFVPALPWAPLLCLLNNIAEIRVDALNYVVSHRRPLPIRVPGIQIWNKFMDIILKVGVLCNAALLAFTSDIVPRLYYKYASGLSSGSYMGYPQFSLSRMQVKDWPVLRDFISEKIRESEGHGGAEHEASTHGLTTAAAGFLRNVTEGHSVHGRSSGFEPAASGGHEESAAAAHAEHGHHEMNYSAVTECYYLDYRQPMEPYGVTEMWWRILCARFAVFTAFIVIFYVLIFLCNFMISDTPNDVQQRVKRRRHIVTKALESGGEAFNRWRRGVAIKNGGPAAGAGGQRQSLATVRSSPLLRQVLASNGQAGFANSHDGDRSPRRAEYRF